MKPFFLLSALLCSLGLAAQSAATPDSLGVPHALPWFLEQGLLHNYAIHIADNRQQTAAENATRANAGMLPSVTASAGYGDDLS